MKNILGLLLLVMLATSCATGYGCPYSATETSKISSSNVDEAVVSATFALVAAQAACEP